MKAAEKALKKPEKEAPSHVGSWSPPEINAGGLGPNPQEKRKKRVIQKE
jgi:hypothetical protein